MNKSLNKYRFSVKPTISEGETALELKRELYGSTLTEIRKVNKKDEEFFDDIIPF